MESLPIVYLHDLGSRVYGEQLLSDNFIPLCYITRTLIQQARHSKALLAGLSCARVHVCILRLQLVCTATVQSIDEYHFTECKRLFPVCLNVEFLGWQADDKPCMLIYHSHSVCQICWLRLVAMYAIFPLLRSIPFLSLRESFKVYWMTNLPLKTTYVENCSRTKVSTSHSLDLCVATCQILTFTKEQRDDHSAICRYHGLVMGQCVEAKWLSGSSALLQPGLSVNFDTKHERLQVDIIMYLLKMIWWRRQHYRSPVLPSQTYSRHWNELKLEIRTISVARLHQCEFCLSIFLTGKIRRTATAIMRTCDGKNLTT